MEDILPPTVFYSLFSGRCGDNFKSVISEMMLWIKFMSICKIAVRHQTIIWTNDDPDLCSLGVTNVTTTRIFVFHHDHLSGFDILKYHVRNNLAFDDTANTAKFDTNTPELNIARQKATQTNYNYWWYLLLWTMYVSYTKGTSIDTVRPCTEWCSAILKCNMTYTAH